MRITYAAIIEAPGPRQSWSAHVPDLDVFATADSSDAVTKQVQAAAEYHVAALRQDGLPVPEPASEIVTITIAT